MLDSQQLSVAEFFWVAVLVALMGREVLQARTHPRPIEIFRPTIIVGVVLAYYALVGPLRAVALGDWIERGVDRRADLIWGWAGAAVFYASTLVGFHLLGTPRLDRRQIGPSDPERLHRLGTTLCQLGLLLFFLVSGLRVFAYLNPYVAGELLRGTSGASVFGGEGIKNYFLLSLNFLIPPLAAYCHWHLHLPRLSLPPCFAGRPHAYVVVYGAPKTPQHGRRELGDCRPAVYGWLCGTHPFLWSWSRHVHPRGAHDWRDLRRGS
jgi:hypothetical protein